MKKSLPLVSIALCTYNGEKYLKSQLDSIINQSYSSLEIIVVDDCSTDQTAELIKKYAEADPRIKFSKNSKNLGFNKNFEKAIQLCTGNFISISDQDDIWKLNKIEVLLKNIGGNWLIFSNSSLIDEQGNSLNKTLLNNFGINNKDFKSLLLYNFVTGHTMLFKKELLNYILPLPKVDYYDWWIGFVAMYHKKIAYCGTSLTQYRIHQKSFIQNKNMAVDLNAIHSTETEQHLLEVSNYKNLEKADLNFIKKTKNSFLYNKLNLFKLIFSNYKLFFPDLKRRKGLSLVNFAWRYASRKSL